MFKMKKKRVNKKGAMELSINTIVIVVIGITLLVLGLVFVRGIFEKLTGLGGGAFQQAEQELKQIQTGDTKINFPATIEVKKGKSSTANLKICNTDGGLTGVSNVVLEITTTQFHTGLSTNLPALKNLGSIDYQKCYPIPVLISSNANTVVNPNEHPFLTLTVKAGTIIYDSIGTTITVT